MAHELAPRASSLPVPMELGELARYGRDRSVQPVLRQGAQHATAERVQAAKAELGVHLVDGLYDFAHESGDVTLRLAFARLEAGGRSEECQAAFQSFSSGLIAQRNGHIQGILELGARGIAREVAREVNVPPEPKRFRLF